MQGLEARFTTEPRGKVTWVHAPPLGGWWLLYNRRDLPAAELASVDDLGALVDPPRELDFLEGSARDDLGCVIGAVKAAIAPAIARL
jgi:hypothetical protein